MRKFIVGFTIFLLLLGLTLILPLAAPGLAQNPDPSKGPDPTPVPLPAGPTPSPTPPPAPQQIDPTLLGKIEPQLLKKLLTGDEPAPFIVYLKTQTDPARVVTGAAAKPLARRTAIVQALQQTARQSQAGVLDLLRNPAGAGLSSQAAVANINPLWIVNGVAATGRLETVLALAARPEVSIVRLDKEVKLDRPQPAPAQLIPFRRPQLQTPTWGLSKIRADLVHAALNIDGSGVVVANIDTGVDWFHPALQSQYRGYTGPGKLPNHSGNWFDAISDNGAVYPTDGNGHGTHTMGTMVGADGIGVAPGARWIAVRAFNNSGGALNSWLHTAFEWMLAPNGDPALAPDIVNNSWGSSSGFSTEFKPDVQALLQAGIYPVFSAGNSGPGAGTVGSPGSLEIAFAVGATDINDDITLFSSRGPSPWGEIKPEVSAPGKSVYSSLPGGTYGNFNGTSMAAPHVSGLAALLLQASPPLSANLSGISQAITSTAVRLGDPIPNNNYGWGRIDAYNAVLSVGSAGALAGIITDAITAAPIDQAQIKITPNLDGPAVIAASDATGAYQQGLAPDAYDVQVSAFGYQPQTVAHLTVVTGATTIQNFSLTPQPSGLLAGRVTDRHSGAPLSATITIEGTPAQTVTTPADGRYRLSLPVGVYTATVVAKAHRISSAVNLNISAGVTTTQDFQLDSAPTILLVDSGRWYQESQIGYYQQALLELGYPHDTWQIIANPFESPAEIPSAATLAGYDIVIWSAPQDSPGYIGADDELEAFLDQGGKLLLSGQDVAFFDGGGAFFISDAAYLEEYLMVDYVADDSNIDALSGTAGGPLAGLSFSISGGDGADNQFYPDVIANANPDFAEDLVNYQDDGLAGLVIGTCVPYRALFLSFGFEAINSQADRNQTLEKALAWLLAAPDPAGVEISPDQQTLIGNFGTTVSHSLRLRNTGQTSDTYNLSLSNGAPYNWPLSSVPPTVTLDACQSQSLTVTVQVPAGAGHHISDTFTLSAQSSAALSLTATATRATKTPAPVLLVDDDRWYHFEAEFEAALQASGVPYDYWNVPKSWSGPVPPSPPLETLQIYPMTVWFTAYDWFQPLTPQEEERLAAYLDGGGRLFFSAQDFLYRHLRQNRGQYGPFPQNYLGIQAHTEDFTSTLTTGQADNPVGAYLGPYALTFPLGYRNWTDGLTPTVTAQVVSRGQANQPNGLSHAGLGPNGDWWHTVFLAYGPELLADGPRARLMQRSLGWLSWLGRSTVQVQTDSVEAGALLRYTATLTNDGQALLPTTYFTATFPAYLSPVAASPELSLSNGAFVWSGPLEVNQSRRFTYTAQLTQTPASGAVISQTSWLAYPEHRMRFDRVAAVEAAPDLSGSVMRVTPTQDLSQGQMLTYTIILKNTGLVDDPLVTTTNTLPDLLTLLGTDAPAGLVSSQGRSLTWTTALSRDQIVTLTFQARLSQTSGGLLKNTAWVEDSFNQPGFALSAQAAFESFPVYLPTILKGD